jgi:hypothetical protein
MEKKYQKLYIWSFIIISGIILAMLYTPLGGNLHDSTFGSYDNYTTPGVNFHGKIGNAPKNGRTNQTRNYNDAMPVNSGTAYSVLSKPVVIGNTSTSQSNFQNGNYQGGGLNFNKTNSGMNSGSAGSGGTGLIALGGGRSGGRAREVEISQVVVFLAAQHLLQQMRALCKKHQTIWMTLLTPEVETQQATQFRQEMVFIF